MGELIGSNIGRVLKVDCPPNSIAWGKCLRVRVLFNISRPLVRGSKIVFNGTTSVVIFLYEKFGDFCFVCGKLDHLDRDSPNLYFSDFNDPKEMHQFEAWLKAEGLKGISVDEVNKSA